MIPKRLTVLLLSLFISLYSPLPHLSSFSVVCCDILWCAVLWYAMLCCVVCCGVLRYANMLCSATGRPVYARFENAQGMASDVF